MKILVVDDNKSICNMLQKFLEIKGHDCTVSLDGRNALDLMLHQKFDFVILDLTMPEFSGYDVIEELEKNGKVEEQNIILLTAASLTTDIINSLLKRGVKSCLKKPITPDVLLKTLMS
ncbi:CheY-like receiver [Nitrosotalea devaniterrae]|uniref:CheY-like receiver n=1 Tax=Nitrosotalea devaniterrae TaxID=1078905 RepID=A0A128A0X3_9ARCH|nr:CheY-like receiver [Candidatus Nitrosotalea devanaterra]